MPLKFYIVDDDADIIAFMTLLLEADTFARQVEAIIEGRIIEET